MFTFLDLLVVVFMVLIAATLLSLCLMFLLKNKTAKRVCFYIVLALALYLSTVGFRIGIGGWFETQIAVSVLTVLLCIGTLVLERVKAGNDKAFLVARVMSAATIVIALMNAIL